MKDRRLLAFIALFFAGVLGFAVFSYASSDLTRNVAGKILLDVENNGEAWYIHPVTLERYYLGRPENAFQIMRQMGLGISNFNLSKIPEEGSSLVGDTDLRKNLAGKILLQVEDAGQAWYVNPATLRRHYLGRPFNAMQIMSDLGLGITHNQLLKIRDGDEVYPSIKNKVPFTAQAPFAEWNDLRQQEGCEEASVLMAMHWVRGTSLSKELAKQEIVLMSDWQKEVYGVYIDTSAKDTATRLLQNYFRYTNFEVIFHIGAREIRDELAKGNLVIVPVNGRSIQNPFFRNGGPKRHMIVITGFDWSTGEFIVNDPGTKRGENYRYSYQTIEESLRDYPSGTYLPIPSDSPSAMIVVSKS